MFVAVGLAVLLALTSHCRPTSSQPTNDIDSMGHFFHWRQTRDLLEMMSNNLKRIVINQLHQQLQQTAHEERVGRLEELLHDSLTGQRRLESQVSQLQQQVGETSDQVTRYASLQHQRFQQQQQQDIISHLSNVTFKLEEVSEKVNTIKLDGFEQLRQLSRNGVVTFDSLTREFTNLSIGLARAKQEILAAYEQQRDNCSAEQSVTNASSFTAFQQGQHQMADAVVELVTLKINDLAVNVSHKLSQVDDNIDAVKEHLTVNTEFTGQKMTSLIHVTNASLALLQTVSQKTDVAQLQQQADEIFQKEMMKLTNNTAQIQLQLLENYAGLQNQVNINVHHLGQVVVELNGISQKQAQQQAAIEKAIDRANYSTLLIQQGQSDLNEFINDTELCEKRPHVAGDAELMLALNETCTKIFRISEQAVKEHIIRGDAESTQFVSVCEFLTSLTRNAATNRTRLVGGRTNAEGRLEVLTDSGVWGTVCDDYFDARDAQVACRSLGFGFRGQPIQQQYGSGTGPIVMDDLHCTGSENSLFSCCHLKTDEHNCNHDEDISISCT